MYSRVGVVHVMIAVIVNVDNSFLSLYQGIIFVLDKEIKSK